MRKKITISNTYFCVNDVVSLSVFKLFKIVREDVFEIAFYVDFEKMKLICCEDGSNDMDFIFSSSSSSNNLIYLPLILCQLVSGEETSGRDYILNAEWPFGGNSVSIRGSWDDWFHYL
jgi:hypothetical protein